MEWRLHPPIDRLGIGRGCAGADVDVAVPRRSVAGRRVVRNPRCLIVGDQVVLDHVYGVVVIAGAPRRVLGQRAEAGADAPDVEAVQPRARRSQLERRLGRGPSGRLNKGQGRKQDGSQGSGRWTPREHGEYTPRRGGHGALDAGQPEILRRYELDLRSKTRSPKVTVGSSG